MAGLRLAALMQLPYRTGVLLTALGLGMLLSGCASPGTRYPGNTPIPTFGLRPEDRVVLGDFSRVMAIGAGLDRVYIVYPEALGIWRPLEQRWEVPRRPVSRTSLRRVTTAAVDPLDQSLWLSGADGWIHYQLEADLWSRERPLTQLPRQPALSEVLRNEPGLEARTTDLLIGPWLSRGTFTAVARAVGNPGWYLGTSVNGAFFIDGITQIPQPLSLGLPGEVVGMLHSGAGGLWIATDRDESKPAALARLQPDLTLSEVLRGPAATGFPFGSIRDLAVDGTRLWLATDQGVMQLAGNGVLEQWGSARGLPGQQALTIMRDRQRTLVGTMRGLVEIDAEGQLHRKDPGFQFPVYALFRNGDTTWLATGNGVFAEVEQEEILLAPMGESASLPLRVPFYGIGRIGDTLVAMSEERVFWRDPQSGSWSPGPLIGPALGPLLKMDAGPGGAWVAGTRGVGVVRPGTGIQRQLLWPGDLPGEVTSVTADQDWLWVGTRAGLVRFRMGRG